MNIENRSLTVTARPDAPDRSSRLQNHARKQVAFCLLLLALATRCLAQDPTFRDEVKLVEVYATVFEQGRAVDNLTRDQFEIRDDGKPQPIRVFEATDRALSCALLLDTTGSMRDSIPQLRNAARDFIGALRPADSIGVYSSTDHLEELQEVTPDHVAARRALVRLRAGGRTALFDAVSQLAREFRRRPGKKVIIVLTDGGDNASVLNMKSAAQSARKSGIPVFAIAEGQALRDGTASDLLRKLAESTGGRVYKASKSSDIENVLAAIAKDLQNGYLLAFKVPEEESATAWHELRISVKDTARPMQVRARTGYAVE